MCKTFNGRCDTENKIHTARPPAHAKYSEKSVGAFGDYLHIYNQGKRNTSAFQTLLPSPKLRLPTYAPYQPPVWPRFFGEGKITGLSILPAPASPNVEDTTLGHYILFGPMVSESSSSIKKQVNHTNEPSQ